MDKVYKIGFYTLCLCTIAVAIFVHFKLSKQTSNATVEISGAQGACNIVYNKIFADKKKAKIIKAAVDTLMESEPEHEIGQIVDSVRAPIVYTAIYDSVSTDSSFVLHVKLISNLPIDTGAYFDVHLKIREKLQEEISNTVNAYKNSDLSFWQIIASAIAGVISYFAIKVLL